MVEHRWDTTTADSISEELACFAALGFAVPIATGHICALNLECMLDWLLKPHGPPLFEGDELTFMEMCPIRHLHC